MKTAPRFIAVFPNISPVSAYITECRVVVSKLTSNPSVPNPAVPLAEVTARLDTLLKDEEAVKGGGPAAVRTRNVSLGATRKDMRLLKAGVQDAADAVGGDEAAAIIVGAGMKLSKKRSRNKPLVAVKYGTGPGGVVLEAKALRKPVHYRWQMSTDQKSWADLPETYKASLAVAGLTPTTIYYFRLRTFTNAGLSDFSTVISIIAH